MNKINYHLEMEKLIAEIDGLDTVPKLLLHSCCAPCSAYVMEYLGSHFHVNVYFYNPNITSESEYIRRYEEQVSFTANLESKYPITVEAGNYDIKDFFNGVKGLEHIPEGGERCFACYNLRLEATAKKAKVEGYDYFCSALTISPLKNASKINEIGQRLAEKYQINYLPNDFKKNNGYKKSIEMSKEANLYRQDYCGCSFSKAEREVQKEQKILREKITK